MNLISIIVSFVSDISFDSACFIMVLNDLAIFIFVCKLLNIVVEEGDIPETAPSRCSKADGDDAEEFESMGADIIDLAGAPVEFIATGDGVIEGDEASATDAELC